jgi:cysteine-rich repeat protein
MRRFTFIICAVVLGVGCSSSHSDAGDAAILFDATMPDAGRDGARPDAPHIAVCQDGVLDPGESCDDGNSDDTDSCNNTCRRNSFCGDNVRDDGEVCDDGDNASGDGCSADCQSNETCGNSIRDIAVGELCDTTPGCASDCHSVTTCGNNEVNAGETCDDGNALPWDGCGADCLTEQDLIINSMTIGSSSVGCDYSGDGNPDNAFARALGSALPLLNSQVSSGVTDGSIMILMSLLGLDDMTGSVDSSVRLAWYQGSDGDDNADNNFSGSAEVYGATSAFDETGAPTTSFASSISEHQIAGGPEDISLPLGFLPLQLAQSHVSGTLTAADGRVSGLTGGLLCGAVSVRTLSSIPNILNMIMSSTPCDTSVAQSTMADVLIGGARSLVTINPSSPDVDVDGDGLESFEVVSTGASMCQPVIVACIDGDGTRIAGHDCAGDARMADGFSTALPFTATTVNVIGLR